MRRRVRKRGRRGLGVVVAGGEEVEEEGGGGWAAIGWVGLGCVVEGWSFGLAGPRKGGVGLGEGWVEKVFVGGCSGKGS